MGWISVCAVEDETYATYRKSVLIPSMQGVRGAAILYLREMACLQDNEGYARTVDVALAMGKEQKKLSTCRKSFI